MPGMAFQSFVLAAATVMLGIFVVPKLSISPLAVIVGSPSKLVAGAALTAGFQQELARPEQLPRPPPPPPPQEELARPEQLPMPPPPLPPQEETAIPQTLTSQPKKALVANAKTLTRRCNLQLDPGVRPKWKLRIGQEYKWALGVQPLWASIDHFEAAMHSCKTGVRSGKTLIVEASTNFLRKLEDEDFDSIHFIDPNINALTALVALVDYILGKSYAQFDGLACLQAWLLESSSEVFVPGYLHDKAALSSSLKPFDPAGYTWQPASESSYKRVQKALKTIIDPNLDIQCRKDTDPLKFSYLKAPPRPCKQLPPLHFRWSLTSNLAWKRMPNDISPVWGAVFATSNDEIQGTAALEKCYAYVPRSSRHLVTVIGGMKFLEYLEGSLYGKITFFDLNVNELSKLTYAFQYIINTPYAEYDEMRCMDDYVWKNHDIFFLPAYMHGKVNMTPMSNFKFHYAGQITPLFSILPPSKYPKYTWKPQSKETYERVQDNLRNAIDPVYQLGFGTVSVPRSTVVVYFTSHVGHDVRSLVKGENHFTLDAYSSLDGYKKGHNMDIIGNAHSWWQFKVSHHTIGTSLHVWSIADRGLLNHPTLQKPYFTAGDVADKFVKRDGNAHHKYDTVILHILMGKAHTHIMSCDKHVQLFKETITQASRVASKRIIIAEANPAAGVFNEPCMLKYDKLKAVISAQLRDGGFSLADEDYACGDSRWGGNKALGVVSNRNVFFIANKA